MNSLNDYNVTLIDKKLAKNMIEKHHYSRTWSTCKYPLGLIKDGFVLGVANYGAPVGRLASDSISPEVTQGNVLELKRLWVAESEGKNTESFFLGQTFAWLKKNDPKIKVLLSYSDPSHGHTGVIYQATNWIYQGQIRSGVEFFAKVHGEILHPRTINVRYGTSGINKIKEIDPKAEIYKIAPKHRYIYILANKREKKRIMKSLKYPPLSYPKELDESMVNRIKSLQENPNSEKFFDF